MVSINTYLSIRLSIHIPYIYLSIYLSFSYSPLYTIHTSLYNSPWELILITHYTIHNILAWFQLIHTYISIYLSIIYLPSNYLSSILLSFIFLFSIYFVTNINPNTIYLYIHLSIIYLSKIYISSINLLSICLSIIYLSTDYTSI